MDELVIDIRKSSSLIRDAAKAVESHLVPGLKLQALMDAEPDADADAKIARLEADILNASATTIMAKSTPFPPDRVASQAVRPGRHLVGEHR